MSMRGLFIGLIVLLLVIISCTVASANNCPNCGAFIPLPWDLTQQIICGSCGWSGFYYQAITPPVNPPLPVPVPPMWYFIAPPMCMFCCETITPYGNAYSYPSGLSVDWSYYIPGNTTYWNIMCPSCFLSQWPDFP
jgi:ribosomal protein S27AE